MEAHEFDDPRGRNPPSTGTRLASARTALPPTKRPLPCLIAEVGSIEPLRPRLGIES